MTIDQFKRGDILRGKLRNRDKAFHPIVYLGDEPSMGFVGIMLTKSEKFEDNIPLEQDHIEINDEGGSKYNFQHNNTHFVRLVLYKPNNWGPYTKVGRLTTKGINFVESKLPEMTPIYWEQVIINHESKR